MYFTLKIVRFLLRLTVKLFLLPFQLVRSIIRVGKNRTEDETYDISADEVGEFDDNDSLSVESTSAPADDAESTFSPEGSVETGESTSRSSDVNITEEHDSPSDGDTTAVDADTSLPEDGSHGTADVGRPKHSPVAESTERFSATAEQKQLFASELRRFEWKSKLSDGGGGTRTENEGSTTTRVSTDGEELATSGVESASTEVDGSSATSSVETVREEGVPTEQSADIAREQSSTTTPSEQSDESEDTTEPPEESTLPDHRVSDRLTAEDPQIRERAITELVQRTQESSLDQSVIETVITRAESDEDDRVRVAACEGLGTIDTARARETLQTLRLDSSSEVSRAATRVLRNFDDSHQ